ncbi:alpha/beta hydrolase family protein [Embleya sp. AB8]|uniref:alpha/beta hydrolase family protein n=1 Tax=Embleya sp. AB8 TaxID=3156304 RepID=UPI003C74290C
MVRTRFPTLLAVFLTATLAVATGLAPGAAARSHPPITTLTLPPPSGPRAIGTVSLHLVDPGRPDPYVASVPNRELMISLWYPTRSSDRHPRAPWLPAAAADRYLRANGVSPDRVSLGLTHGRMGAPVARGGNRLPVVVYSPGANASRAYGTGVVEELASRGYLVVTIDHTYDAGVVEFPGGRVAVPAHEVDDFAKAVAVRTADTRFVLDRLGDLAAGRNPDAERAALPEGLAGAPDLDRIGMFGHSLGGATTSATMLADPRIKAGAGLDGAALGPVVEAGLDRPYLVVDTLRKGGMAGNPALRAFWSHLRGWRLELTVAGAAHQSFGDDAVLLPLLAPHLNLSRCTLESLVGSIPTARATAFQRAYPVAFFEQHLRGRGHLLDAPSPRFPEVTHNRDPYPAAPSEVEPEQPCP